MNAAGNNHLAPAGAFTAARFAACLGTSPQAVRKGLLDTPATGIRIIGGVEAAAWSLDSLPGPLRSRMEEAARGKGCRNALAMLAELPKQWQPALPLDK